MLEEQKYRYTATKCTKCGSCRVALRQSLPSCPSGFKFGFDSYYSLGRMEIARSLLEGQLQWSPKLADRYYKCLLCGQCDAHCWDVMGLRPLEVLIEMRRELVRRGFGPPAEHAPLMASLKERNNPHLRDNKDRNEWAKGIKAKKVDNKTDVLFFVGCAVAFDPTSQVLAKSTASLLNKAGINWGYFGEEEICCGLPAFDVGVEDEVKRLTQKNVEKIKATGVKAIVTDCTGCFNMIKKEWPKYAKLDIPVYHISEYSWQLLNEGKLKITGKYNKKVTIHDPCLLGRYNGIYEPPREVLKAIPGVTLVEMQRSREEAWCCGAGGGALISYPEWAAENATQRLEEAANTGASAMVVPSCPECWLTFDIALHGYGAAVKMFSSVWQKAPSTLKFLGIAQKLGSPLLKLRKKVDIDVVDETKLLDSVTS